MSYSECKKKTLKVLRDDESKRFKYLKRPHVICYFDPCLQPLSCWPLLPTCLSTSAVTLNNVGLWMSPAGSPAAIHQPSHAVRECHASAWPLFSPVSPFFSASARTSVWLFFCCVVFLAGLAKPMGLVEGPGGLGQGGAAATLGEDSHDAEGKYEEYGYNAQLSDRISLDRSIPDYRPKKYIHLLFLLFFFPSTVWNMFFPPRQACIMLGRLVTGRFASLIPVAVDGFYFCESTQHKAGLFYQKTWHFHQCILFFPFAPWSALHDIYCATVLGLR